jgi:site-specific recombinase XerD
MWVPKDAFCEFAPNLVIGISISPDKHLLLNFSTVKPEVYRPCDSLQQAISRLYRQAGIKQGSSHSGRRSFAAKVLAATGDVEIVQTILGHACSDHSKPYLTVNMRAVRRAFELALA